MSSPLHLYLDTSALLARWAPQDPHHLDSLTLFQGIASGAFLGYLSDFSLVEIAAVVERQQAKFSGKLPSLPASSSLALEYLKKVLLSPNVQLISSLSLIHI